MYVFVFSYSLVGECRRRFPWCETIFVSRCCSVVVPSCFFLFHLTFFLVIYFLFLLLSVYVNLLFVFVWLFFCVVCFFVCFFILQFCLCLLVHFLFIFFVLSCFFRKPHDSRRMHQGALKTDARAILYGEGSLDKELFELPIMIKADVQGSEQALHTALR